MEFYSRVLADILHEDHKVQRDNKRQRRNRFNRSYDCYETLIFVAAGAGENLHGRSRNMRVDIKMTNCVYHDGGPNIFAQETVKLDEWKRTDKFARFFHL